MNVATAKAQLSLAETSEEYLEAKAAYQADPEKKPAFLKAQSKLVAARDDWRNNHRTAPSGEGDGTAQPDAVSASLEVK